jgi:2-amino-4-hydroxy-6-hydroxymethyldihydropteridine diphosphokinase
MAGCASAEQRESPKPSMAWLGLGASLGDRLANLHSALSRLQERGVRIRAVSPVYESPHLGLDPTDSKRYPPHLNVVAEIETRLSPEALLDLVQAVEAEGGRERLERWGPRTIDIDILAFGAVQKQTERLALPHPGIGQRAFVARPLLDLQTDFRLGDGTLLRERLDEEPLKSQPIAKTDGRAWERDGLANADRPRPDNSK